MQSSFNSELSPLLTRKISKPRTAWQELLANFKYQRNYFCVLADVFVRSWLFAKVFCLAGEVEIQDYAPEQKICGGIFLYYTYYYYGEGTFIHTRLAQQPPFSYRFQAYFVENLINLKNDYILFCCITHHKNYIIYLKAIQTKYG